MQDALKFMEQMAMSGYTPTLSCMKHSKIDWEARVSQPNQPWYFYESACTAIEAISKVHAMVMKEVGR